MTSTARPGPGGVPHLGPPTALRRNLVIGAIGATIVLGWIGDAFWASLVDRNPLALILLNAKPRYLLLTVNDLDPWVYYTVATVPYVVPVLLTSAVARLLYGISPRLAPFAWLVLGLAAVVLMFGELLSIP